MGSNTKRIHDKFEFWSTADCDCSLCVNFAGNKKPCPLDVCCIEDIRQEALRRENAATKT